MKTIYIVLFFGMGAWALYEQTQPNPNIWVQIVAVVIFFYGMMKLMEKVPGKNQEEEERDV
ncbi:hypothetical protein [Flavobacterium cerinum]|uniref:Uncharacterized protein n=1 Tax=Flavobacterium cerinum TaxID=2502784 RepID=A0ABY5IRC8_9FLAO|nr:hypothetical protein [Flavobacterium cerinum]UUC45403.1 hypothetical protein NOX80_17475 [Flavobacterium cerinum]